MTPEIRQRMIELLDEVADATWAWEEAEHGPHPHDFRGRIVFEAVMDLQEYLLHEQQAEVYVVAREIEQRRVIDLVPQPDGTFGVMDGWKIDLDIRNHVRLQDNPTLRGLARACWPKEQHKTQGAAEAQLRSITKRGLEKNTDTIHAYLCLDCGCWHVGHGV